MESEKLIEEVRKFPVLYDQSDAKYRHVEYKERVWKIISETLKVPGMLHFFIVIILFHRQNIVMCRFLGAIDIRRPVRAKLI